MPSAMNPFVRSQVQIDSLLTIPGTTQMNLNGDFAAGDVQNTQRFRQAAMIEIEKQEEEFFRTTRKVR